MIRFLPPMINISLSFQQIHKETNMSFRDFKLIDLEMNTYRKFRRKHYFVFDDFYSSTFSSMKTILKEFPTGYDQKKRIVYVLHLIRVDFALVVSATIKESCRYNNIAVYDGPEDLNVLRMSGTCKKKRLSFESTTMQLLMKFQFSTITSHQFQYSYSILTMKKSQIHTIRSGFKETFDSNYRTTYNMWRITPIARIPFSFHIVDYKYMGIVSVRCIHGGVKVLYITAKMKMSPIWCGDFLSALLSPNTVNITTLRSNSNGVLVYTYAHLSTIKIEFSFSNSALHGVVYPGLPFLKAGYRCNGTTIDDFLESNTFDLMNEIPSEELSDFDICQSWKDNKQFHLDEENAHKKFVQAIFPDHLLKWVFTIGSEKRPKKIKFRLEYKVLMESARHISITCNPKLYLRFKHIVAADVYSVKVFTNTSAQEEFFARWLYIEHNQGCFLGGGSFVLTAQYMGY